MTTSYDASLLGAPPKWFDRVTQSFMLRGEQNEADGRAVLRPLLLYPWAVTPGEGNGAEDGNAEWLDPLSPDTAPRPLRNHAPKFVPADIGPRTVLSDTDQKPPPSMPVLGAHEASPEPAPDTLPPASSMARAPNHAGPHHAMPTREPARLAIAPDDGPSSVPRPGSSYWRHAAGPVAPFRVTPFSTPSAGKAAREDLYTAERGHHVTNLSSLRSRNIAEKAPIASRHRAAESTIEIRIGRVDVRANIEPTPHSPPTGKKESPFRVDSLASYLDRRTRGTRS